MDQLNEMRRLAGLPLNEHARDFQKISKAELKSLLQHGLTKSLSRIGTIIRNAQGQFVGFGVDLAGGDFTDGANILKDPTRGFDSMQELLDSMHDFGIQTPVREDTDETQFWDADDQHWEQYGIKVRYFDRKGHVGVQAVDMKTGEVLAHDSHPSTLNSQIRNLLRTRPEISNGRVTNEDEQDGSDAEMERQQKIESTIRRMLKSMSLDTGPNGIFFETPNDVEIALEGVPTNGVPLQTLQYFTDFVQGVRISARDNKVIIHLTLK